MRCGRFGMEQTITSEQMRFFVKLPNFVTFPHTHIHLLCKSMTAHTHTRCVFFVFLSHAMPVSMCGACRFGDCGNSNFGWCPVAKLGHENMRLLGNRPSTTRIVKYTENNLWFMLALNTYWANQNVLYTLNDMTKDSTRRYPLTLLNRIGLDPEGPSNLILDFPPNQHEPLRRTSFGGVFLRLSLTAIRFGCHWQTYSAGRSSWRTYPSWWALAKRRFSDGDVGNVSNAAAISALHLQRSCGRIHSPKHT